jgi:aspartate/tyrosine/aromatic aminotransferase
VGEGWHGQWVVLCWVTYKDESITPQKGCFRKFLFFLSQPRLCKKWKNPLQEMDESTHKMEDSTMKQKTLILEQDNLSFIQQETKI